MVFCVNPVRRVRGASCESLDGDMEGRRRAEGVPQDLERVVAAVAPLTPCTLQGNLRVGSVGAGAGGNGQMQKVPGRKGCELKSVTGVRVEICC